MRMKLSVKLCLVALAAYLAAAVFGEVQYRVARYRDVTPAYNAVNTEERFMPPSAEHWLGTDNLGRDVGLRLVQGARIAFHVGIMTSLIAIPLGVLLGLLGGYFGGKVDSLVVWLCATVASMPGLLFILAISLVVGQGHILPNVAHIILIQFSIRFPSAVSTEVFISFLGIGVQGEPSWGVMINNARARLWQGVWWEMTFTTLAIFALVLVFNHLADYLRDRLDPALRSER